MAAATGGGHALLRHDLDAWLDDVARPAIDDVARQLQRTRLAPEVTRDVDHLRLTVPHGDRGTFSYGIRVRGFRTPTFSWVESPQMRDMDHHHYRALAQSSEGEPSHDVTGMTRDQVSHDLVARYASFRQVRRIA